MADSERPADADGAQQRARPRRTKLSLAALLYLSVCVAVCVAAAVARPAGSELSPASLDWLRGLSTLASVGLATALLQQAWAIRGLPRYRVAMVVRGLMAGGLALCVLSELLIASGAVVLAERAGSLFLDRWSEPFPDAIWLLLLIAGAETLSQRAIAASVVRTRWSRLRSRGAFALFWGLAACVAAEGAAIHYLVHIATAGIEYARPVAFQRVGVFPSPAAEGFFTYRVAIASLIGLAGTAAIPLVVARRTARRARVAAWVALLTGSGSLAGYCWWFYTCEMPRVSPDLASAPVVAVPRDFLAGLLLISGVALWLACSLAASTPDAAFQRHPVGGPLGRLPEDLTTCGLLAAAAFGFLAFQAGLVSVYRDVFGWAIPGGAGKPLLVFLLRATVTSPCAFALVAMMISGARLALARGHDPAIRRLSAGRVAEAFAMLMLVGCVAAPTLAAYSFAAWLGPWYR